jgi:hypothetical protein
MKRKVRKFKKINRYFFVFVLVIIKCEPSLDTSEIENKNNNVSVEPANKVVVRIPRIDYNTK